MVLGHGVMLAIVEYLRLSYEKPDWHVVGNYLGTGVRGMWGRGKWAVWEVIGGRHLGRVR